MHHEWWGVSVSSTFNQPSTGALFKKWGSYYKGGAEGKGSLLPGRTAKKGEEVLFLPIFSL